ncbi:G-protein coupled receptor 143 [Turdus rufiventris]|nr:G-protein coupled receptor 143 [Turdus rufiventris]
MASPRLETYCCPNRDAATQLVMNFQPEVFCGVCIGSASISLLLTILQLLPKKGQSPRKMPKASSSSTILLLISICDILGGLGMIFRSSVWLGFPDFIANISVVNGTDVWPSTFCVGSARGSYFYLAMWEVLTPLPMPGMLGACSTIVLYHMMTWGLAVMLCVEGIALLYYPSLSSCENGLEHAIPHYITTYAPLLLVLVANPILFRRTVSAVASLLKGRQGIYTENERRLGTEIQMRFFKIMLVFVICWSSNIINETLLFYLEMQPDINEMPLKNIRSAALITWIIMGVLNPMQGFLFTLAFYGWTGWRVDLKWRKREIPWESMSSSTVGENVYPSPVNYQSNIHDSKKISTTDSQQTDEAISMLSEGNTSSDERLTRSSPIYQGW